MNLIPPSMSLLLVVIGAILVLLACVIILRTFLSKRIIRSQQEEREKWEKIVREKDKELEKTKLEAQTANSAKSRFLASISHEIRTPMNAIMGLTELVMNTELNSLQRKYLSKIRNSANSLLRIINDLLDFSRIESGMLDIEKTPFSLDFLFQRVYDHCADAAREKGLTLTFDTDPKVPQYIKGDHTRLAQVLINLVNNAVKFTDQGYVQVEAVPIRVETDKVQLQFLVRDSGSGIHTEQLHKIFESFLQADTSLTRRHGGLGLGLSISKHLVQMMGGEIWLESEPGQGSCFYFLLWFELVDENSEKEHALTATPESENDYRNASPPEWNKDIQDVHILLVDDNETNRELVREMFHEGGARVSEASNGRQALEILQEQDFDIVFLDLEMPEMNGFETVGRIRAAKDQEDADSKFSPLNPDIPVIAMTGHASAEDKRQCLQAGMDDYISKPFNLEKILEIIRSWTVTDSSDAGLEKGQSGTAGIASQDISTNGSSNTILKPEQLQKIRQRFLQRYSQEEKSLQEYLEARETQKAFRFVHDIKTMAGYMGEQALYNFALHLEQEMDSRDRLPSSALLKNFQEALRDTFRNLAQQGEGTAEKEEDSLPEVKDLNALSSILRELYPEVEQNKPRACQPLLDELQQYSWPRPYNSQIGQLGQLIKKYRFREARDIISEMLQTLPGADNKV
ncbi:MAG: response regulator [Thermodesulfobacteriota bacterium]